LTQHIEMYYTYSGSEKNIHNILTGIF